MKTIMKNYSSWALALILPITVLSGLVTFVVGASMLGQTEVTKSYLRALLWNIRNMPLTLHSRILTQKPRRTSDREILMRMSKRSSIVRSYLEIHKLEVRKPVDRMIS